MTRYSTSSNNFACEQLSSHNRKPTFSDALPGEVSCHNVLPNICAQLNIKIFAVVNKSIYFLA